MPTIEIQGQKLFYALHASDARQADNVILLHGAGGSRLVWPASLRRLPRATVHVLDLPGHGRSAGQGRMSIKGYASVVASFIEDLSLAPAVVIGHSMGGAIAQLLALETPSLLKGLVLLATGARLRVAPAILEQLRSDFAAAADTILTLYWGPDAPEPLIESGRRLLLQNDRDVVYGDFAACDVFDVTRRLSSITLPALVISGAADRLTPEKYGRYLADGLPDARLAIIEGGGHMLMLEKAPLVTDAVIRFLEEI
ncbi:MAG TPA: alpha/beta hydrolase [Candidatus Sulfomarinibacteraceae bacterium]|nr:alpha/beta hydrolase [Candidatus Sulfomarinibacteraceae bacterium]